MKCNTYYLFFQTLANKLKIDIITALQEKPHTVTELGSTLNVEQSKLSHALKNLLMCRIVEVQPQGKTRVYSLNKETIVPLLKLVEQHGKNFCKSRCPKCEGE